MSDELDQDLLPPPTPAGPGLFGDPAPASPTPAPAAAATGAATATSAFWLALTAGRFIAIPVSMRWPAPALVTGCCAGMVVFLLLAVIPAAAPWAYGGLGFICAPLWATGLPWLTRAAPKVAAASA